MDTQLSFRFLAPEEDLPGPLPTVAAIKSAQGPDILDDRRGSPLVVRVNSHFVVKYGVQIDSIEGENMLFVKESTNVRIPKVYALFTEVSTNINFIVMEYIQGKTLGSCWKSLDHHQKQLIATQLQNYFDEFRRLPSPGNFASIDKGGLRDPMFWSVDRHRTFCGPFETIDGIVEAPADKARYTRQKFDPRYEKANFFEVALKEILRGHKPVFTHGDLHPDNVIVPDDGRGLVLIDWAWAGFYPSCWENCTALFHCLGFEDDWHAWVGKILGNFYAEYAWLYLIRENQFM